MELLFLDFESQGDNPELTNVTEVGALLIELLPDVVPIRRGFVDQLVYDPSYPPQTPEITEITGITDSDLQTRGLPPRDVFATLIPLVKQADYVLAHNAYGFDKIVYESTSKRLGLEIGKPKIDWIDTLVDVPYPKKYKCRKLSHLAYDHGIMVDPSTLHRAINDVELMARFILDKYPMDVILAYKAVPWVYVFLNGVKAPWEDGGVTNAQAKALGYGWEGARHDPTNAKFHKRWVKLLKETELQAEKAKVPPQFKLTKQVQAPVPSASEAKTDAPPFQGV